MLQNGRHDIGYMYTRGLVQISLFVEDAVKIMVDNGWMEQPPYAAERDKIATDSNNA